MIVLFYYNTSPTFIPIKILITRAISIITKCIIKRMLAHNTFHPRITHHLSNTDPSIRILIQALINKCRQLNTNKIVIIDNFYILDIEF